MFKFQKLRNEEDEKLSAFPCLVLTCAQGSQADWFPPAAVCPLGPRFLKLSTTGLCNKDFFLGAGWGVRRAPWDVGLPPCWEHPRLQSDGPECPQTLPAVSWGQNCLPLRSIDFSRYRPHVGTPALWSRVL